MPLSPDRWKTITESAFPWEREALDFVRQRLPDHEPYRAWSNFEFVAPNGAIYEVDLVVLSPKGFFLVEIKSQPGELAGDSHTWTWTSPDGRRHSADNPIYLANKKAKLLAALLDRLPAVRAMKGRAPFLKAAVFCSAADLVSRLDPAARAHIFFRDDDTRAPDVPSAKPGIVRHLTSWKPGDPDDPGSNRVDKPTAKALSRAMEEAGIRPTNRFRRVGDYELGALLGEGPGFQDWEARHRSLDNLHRRIRLYPLELGASEERRSILRRAAEREFRILEGVRHDGLLAALDYTVHERGPALLFEHRPGSVRLDHYLRDRAAPLDENLRLDLLRQIGEGLRYAHEKRLFHRALSPQSILVLDPAAPLPRIRIFNWQSAARDAGTTTGLAGTTGTLHPEQLVEGAAQVYLAPEIFAGLGGAEDLEAIDIFSLGTIAYRLFAGQPPAASVTALRDRLGRDKGLKLSAVVDGVPHELERLVFDSTRTEASQRLASVQEFLAGLEDYEDAITRAEPEQVVDPNDAKPGDLLEGGFTVVRRLGTGSTAVALLVQHGDDESVLKLALTPEQNARIREEGDTLDKIRHQSIVALKRKVEIGGRAGLLLAQAGDETLAHRLRQEGRLQVEFLHRFGEDLLQAVDWLEQKGVAHRDIKPDNIGVPEQGKSKRPHLVLFDFSLSRTPPENIRAGTRPYLDPFLDTPGRRRWDLHAERFAAAVTLYEMATGTLPRWGDGHSDAAVIEAEVTIESDLFDPDLRTPLPGFFAKALARDVAKRFDNAEEMLRAWRKAFEIPERRPEAPEPSKPADLAAALAGVTRATQVALLPLGTRAQNALDRLGVVTAGDLVGISLWRINGMRGVGHQTRREIADVLTALTSLLPAEPGATAPPRPAPKPKDDEAELDPATASLDVLASRLLPARVRRGETRTRMLELLLGFAPFADRVPRLFPSQSDVATELGVTRANVGIQLGKERERWAHDPVLTHAREQLPDLLERQGGVMTVAESAQALAALRGSTATDDERTRRSLAVLRALIEAERDANDPRFILRRSNAQTLVARSQALADYALRLGQLADELAASDPLPSPARVVEALRAVAVPGETVLTDARLVSLATAASSKAAASSRLEIYPRRMPAERAIRLASGALLGGGELTVDEIARRVAGRYPDAEPLPGRPTLDGLVAESGLDWNPTAANGAGAYVFRPPPGSSTFTSALSRHTTSAGRMPRGARSPEEADAWRFEERLQRAARDAHFLALTVRPKDFALAERELVSRFPVERMSIDVLLIRALRAEAERARVKWPLVLAADASDKAGDRQRLGQLVSRAMPAVEQALLSSARIPLVVEAGLLARYEKLDVLQRLRDHLARPGGPPGLWLLIPSDDQAAMPLLDHQPVPVISPTEWARIPDAWVSNLHRAAG